MADGEVIERLVVQFDADVQKLIDKMSGLNRTLHSHQADFEKIDLGAGIDKSFNSARMQLMEEGSSKLGAFGAGLEALGPAGLAAAAGIAAMGFAIEGALKTAEWAEDLERASKALGLTTTQLQEFDFIAKAIGVPVESMRSSLGGLERTIGQVETGAGKAKAATEIFVKGLHITPEDLKGWGDLNTQLPHILDALSKVDNEARLAFAAKLRIDPAVLNSLIEARGHLSDLTDQAHRYGIVVDEGVIQKSADAAEKLHIASEVIDKELKVAFAGLVGPLAQGATLLAEFTVWLGKIPALGESARLALIPLVGPLALLIPGSSGPKQFVTPKMMADFATGDHPGGTTPFVGGGGGHASKYDIQKADLDAIAKAQEAELRARLALSHNVELRLSIEEQLLATEIQAQKADLDHKKLDPAARATAQAALDKEADERKAALQRQAAFDIEDRQIEVYKAQTEAAIAELESQAAMATTAEARAKIELDILKLRQQLARDLRDTLTDRGVKLGDFTPEQGAAIKAAGAAVDNAAVQSKIYQNFYNPIHDALSAAIHGGWPGLVDYMKSKLEEGLINALSNAFAQSLSGGFPGGGGGGGLSSLFSTAFSLFGFADGTDSAPGGWSVVGERGPELMNLRPGATIVPNHVVNSAMASTGAGSAAGGGVVYLHVQVDAKDAVLSQTVAQWITHGIAAAAPHIQREAKADTLQALSRAQQWRLS